MHSVSILPPTGQHSATKLALKNDPALALLPVDERAEHNDLRERREGYD